MRTAEYEAVKLLSQLRNLIKECDPKLLSNGEFALRDFIFKYIDISMKECGDVQRAVDDAIMYFCDLLSQNNLKESRKWGLGFLVKTCAYCFGAIVWHKLGDIVNAWKSVNNASINYGMCVSYLFAIKEDRHSKIDKKTKNAKYGSQGGLAKGAKTKPFKDWAIEKARTRRGNPTEIARSLIPIIPDYLKPTIDHVVDIERLTRDAIAASQKDNE